MSRGDSANSVTNKKENLSSPAVNQGSAIENRDDTRMLMIKAKFYGCLQQFSSQASQKLRQVQLS